GSCCASADIPTHSQKPALQASGRCSRNFFNSFPDLKKTPLGPEFPFFCFKNVTQFNPSLLLGISKFLVRDYRTHKTKATRLDDSLNLAEKILSEYRPRRFWRYSSTV